MPFSAYVPPCFGFLPCLQKRSVMTATFSVKCDTQFGEELRVVGDVPALGQWDPKKGPTMQWTEGNVWEITIPIHFPPDLDMPLQFKYVLMQNGKVKEWELGDENRVVSNPSSRSSVVCRDVWGSLEVKDKGLSLGGSVADLPVAGA